ncbi:pimeloyl-ACP methyl ester carboxylesterase [Orenia metallireducens]|uniref:Pimeloyl-ACP methyl ester carboxylesterase n=2 Tax=Orenia metallireducens TaxID=1413210 RepID=A0A285FX65_9FIRM|nr:alpha/beta hydrolase [Orenia metallireducens]PRX35581.1 pimeloyl-ACP methyl ester carboxylesterase [Orenia metallireducens]SNY15930.1 Pimeloyl-ACP methyl ester carboxylesterase [Orenia metallireducens]
MKLMVVFPGWGTSRSLYQELKLVGYELFIVDFFDKKSLMQEIASLNPTEINFLGWSLGAIMALKYLNGFKVNKLILLAPTLYFLENQPSTVIKKMIRDLARNKLRTLVNFSRLNFYDKGLYQDYLTQYKGEIKELSSNYLKEGLEFLLEEDLRDISIIEDIRPLVIMGKEDQIITNSSSKQVLDCFIYYDFYMLEGVGHNILYEAEVEVNNLIREYLND